MTLRLKKLPLETLLAVRIVEKASQLTTLRIIKAAKRSNFEVLRKRSQPHFGFFFSVCCFCLCLQEKLLKIKYTHKSRSEVRLPCVCQCVAAACSIGGCERCAAEFARLAFARLAAAGCYLCCCQNALSSTRTTTSSQTKFYSIRIVILLHLI